MTPNPLKMVLSGVLQASLFLSVAFFGEIVSLVPAIRASERQDEFFRLGHICSAHVHCSDGEREQSYRRKVPPVLQSHHTSVPLLLFLQPCVHHRGLLTRWRRKAAIVRVRQSTFNHRH